MSAQWSPKSTEWYYPVPPVVKPANTPGQPPSDAIILFDGKDLSKWVDSKGEPAQWTISGNEMIVAKGDILTREYFGDCQLHIEFKSPNPKAINNYNGQNAGNSGIFLQNTYEVQILDADNNSTYVNGMVGSIYKQSAPLANAYTKNGEWQVYDIYWKAPKFAAEDKLETPAMITVVLNGVLIQNNYILKGGTPYIGLPKYTAHGRLPIRLQDHGSPVAFRNIWIRNL
ncbi:endo-1,3-1,4-beta glucanase-related protein [Bacteroidia bacterium]|nr:endo-1,3-1,4-beta glucanase-related protein [Bacteroidia bacterium]